MLNFWNFVSGMVRLEIVSADCPGLLTLLGNAGISIVDLQQESDLTIRFSVVPGSVRTIRKLCSRRGDRVKILKTRGLFFLLKRLISRPCLLLGLLFIVGLFLFLPTRVFFFQVEGNIRLPDNQILEAADSCGLHFGASRAQVRSEQLKNAMMQKLPELQWVGVNTRGCVAVISVKERHPEPKVPEDLKSFSMTASRDAVVDSCTAYQGTLLCRPGQAVSRGQILISGIQPGQQGIRITGADGEVYGRTLRDLSSVSPAAWYQKGDIQDRGRAYSLILGKNRIKIWESSGNWDAGCGRMYAEYYLTLPGGYVLPFALAVDRYTSRELKRTEISPDQAEAALKAFSETYLRRQMIGGSLLSGESDFGKSGGTYHYHGQYECREMIGRFRREKIGE